MSYEANVNFFLLCTHRSRHTAAMKRHRTQSISHKQTACTSGSLMIEKEYFRHCRF